MSGTSGPQRTNSGSSIYSPRAQGFRRFVDPGDMRRGWIFSPWPGTGGNQRLSEIEDRLQCRSRKGRWCKLRIEWLPGVGVKPEILFSVAVRPRLPQARTQERVNRYDENVLCAKLNGPLENWANEIYRAMTRASRFGGVSVSRLLSPNDRVWPLESTATRRQQIVAQAPRAVIVSDFPVVRGNSIGLHC